MGPGSELTRTNSTASHQRTTPFRAPARGLATVAVWLVLSTPVAAQVADSHFTDNLYPALNEAGCRGCHTDAGVASGTRLHFPAEDASAEEVRAFGLRLAFLVDRGQPEESLLFGKPTNRIKHTGGERIVPGSETEGLLLDWVKRLVTLSDAELAQVLESSSPRSGSAKHHVAMRRLTHRQYDNTVRALLGDQTRPSNQFPSEDFVHGFKNQAEGQSIPPLLAEAYGAAAEKLARNAFRGGDRNGLVPCPPSSAGDADCRGRFVRQFGLKAFRRPLTEAEATQYERLFAKEAARTDDFLQGARIVVEAMFQSPSFLFLAEAAPGDELYPYTMASRLSFFLWDAPPNDDLLAEAAAGKLNPPGQVEATARRMLDDPRARSSMEEFLAQWLRFDRVLTTIRDRRLYRDFNPELAAAMTEETRRLFSHLAWGDGNFMEFFTAKYGFVSTDLAEIYGFPAPAEEFARVDFPADTGRAGVLGQAMFQTVTSKPSDTSVTERGLFIRDHFLCQTVPPPPPGLNAALPARQRREADDEPRAPQHARHESRVRELPSAHRPDRLRLRAIRRYRPLPRETRPDDLPDARRKDEGAQEGRDQVRVAARRLGRGRRHRRLVVLEPAGVGRDPRRQRRLSEVRREATVPLRHGPRGDNGRPRDHRTIV